MRMMFALLFGLVMLTLVCQRSYAREVQPSTVGAPEIQQMLYAAHDLLGEWHVKYEVLDHDGDAGSVLFVRSIAARADQLVMWSRKSGPGYEWSGDPYQTRFIVTPAGAVREFPLSQAFERFVLAPHDPVPDDVSSDWLFFALGWWPFADRPAPRMRGVAPIVLPEVAASRSYVVRPAQELVADTWCHVLEYPGRDRLWVDVDRGLIMRRELLDNDRVRHRLELTGHEEVSPSLWVPTEVRVIVPHPMDQAAIVSDMLIAMRRILVNQPLADELFQLTDPRRMVEFSPNGRLQQEAPIDPVHLDAVAEWLQRHCPQFLLNAPSRDFNVVARHVAFSVGCCAATIAVLLGGLRRHRRSRSGMPTCR